MILQIAIIAVAIIVIIVQYDVMTRNFNRRMTIRRLMYDHVLWTREFLNAKFNMTSDIGRTQKRLLQNQTDIGMWFAYDYGSQWGNAVANLMREHIIIAARIVDELQRQHDPTELIKQWNQNCDIVSRLVNELTGNNIHDLMKEHLTLTIQEATLMMNGTSSDTVVDSIVVNILEISDRICGY